MSMADYTLPDNFEKELQEEADKFNEENGIQRVPEDHNKSPNPSVVESTKEDGEDFPDLGEDTNTDPLDDIESEDAADDNSTKNNESKTDKDDDKKEDEEELNGYVDLENSDGDIEDLGIKPDDPIGVQKRIGKEVQRRKALEAQNADMKAQLDQLMLMVTGAKGNIPSVNQVPPNFIPPQAAKPYENMDDLEKVDYLIQVNEAKRRAAQEQVQQQMNEQKRKSEIDSVLNALKENIHDPVINELFTRDRGHYTEHMLRGIAKIPNKASMIRYLHTQKNAELAVLKNQSPEDQLLGMGQLIERANQEIKLAHSKKAVAAKPAPPGKLKNATLPNAGSKRSVYDPNYLDNLSLQQLNKLMSKGY